MLYAIMDIEPPQIIRVCHINLNQILVLVITKINFPQLNARIFQKYITYAKTFVNNNDGADAAARLEEETVRYRPILKKIGSFVTELMKTEFGGV